MIKKDGKYRKELYCSQFQELADEESVVEVFLLDGVRYCSSSRQVKWLELKLSDSSGSISARVWGENIRMGYQNLEGKLVIVYGKVHLYVGRPELAVEMIQEVEEDVVDLQEILLQISDDEAEKLTASIETMMGKIQDSALAQYVSMLLPRERLKEMRNLPVHVNGHHNFRGGLLVHTFEVAFGAYYHVKAVSGIRTQEVDLDLIAAGALLHDIGVFQRVGYKGYSCCRMPFDSFLERTAGYELLCEAKKNCISDEVFAHLWHIIESAHNGGPQPKTMEAMAVKAANWLSIEMKGLEDSFRSMDQYKKGAAFTWSKILDREVYRLRRDEALCE